MNFTEHACWIGVNQVPRRRTKRLPTVVPSAMFLRAVISATKTIESYRLSSDSDQPDNLQKQLVMSLLNNQYAIQAVHDVLTDTVNFLRDATDDLLSARKRCETEEHIQDAKMERNKLLDRFTIIEK
ncbi:hypothetical protein PRIPAC_85958, partial [Pristionchus pacificus]